MPDLAQFRSLYDQLAPAPGTTYGTLLPIARDDATGEYRLALPTQLRDTAMGWLDLLAGPKTGEVTPLASLALMNTPIAAPGGSLGTNAVMRTARAADAQAAKSIAANASQKAARQAWVWKEPGGKFVVNSGARPKGAAFVGRQIDDEWFGSGLMAKTGSKETTAASAAATSLPMDEASRMARADKMFPVDAYHGVANRLGDERLGYLGTSSDIESFDLNRLGNNSGSLSGFSFSSSPDVASSYAQNVRVVRPDWYNKEWQEAFGNYYSKKKAVRDTAREKIKKLYSINDEVTSYETYARDGAAVMPVRLNPGKSKVFDANGRNFRDININDLAKSAKDEGFDSLIVKNVIDPGNIDPAAKKVADTTFIFDPSNIRSRFAAFDPAKTDSADLLASRAGLGLPIVPLDSGYASLNEQLSGAR